MKKVINAGIGGRSFTIDEDAYQKLEAYLSSFRKQANMGYESKEVMDEVESRIADLFSEALSAVHQDVVNLRMVEDVIFRIGMPDGSTEFNTEEHTTGQNVNAQKRLYRNPDSKIIGGVCGGLAAYFDVDVTIIRILAVIALFFGSAGFWAYIVFWIVAPVAVTATQKCEMHGIPATAENIRRFSNKK